MFYSLYSSESSIDSNLEREERRGEMLRDEEIFKQQNQTNARRTINNIPPTKVTQGTTQRTTEHRCGDGVGEDNLRTSPEQINSVHSV